MNECNQKFLEKNGISIEDICSKVDCHIYSIKEVNDIVAENAFYKEKEKKMVSIMNIVGYDTSYRNINPNIFLSMDDFFDNNGSGYYLRSVGMLEYDKDNILEMLKNSFQREPISLLEVGDGNYTILNNGLHRYTLLRILYLSEVAKANGDKEKLKELSEKYTIPADVTEIDLEKTYSKYLLMKVKPENMEWNVVDVSGEYDDDYRQTGNVVVEYGNGMKDILTNELLLDLTKERVLEDESYKDNYFELQQKINKHKSFEGFIKKEFVNIIPLEKQEDKEKGIY